MEQQPLPGITNLLRNCIKLQPGDAFLIVEEPPTESLYDPALTGVIAEHARALGARVTMDAPALVADPADFPTDVLHQIRRSDHTLFLSRIGDFARFTPMPGDGSKTICYARHEYTFDSPFAGSCHVLLSTLLQRLESELGQATSWHIRCPLGTDISGTFPPRGEPDSDQFSMALFPVTTFNPIGCASATGSVALSRWLMPGAAAKVGPIVVPFEGVVNARVKGGVIVGFDGERGAVSKIEEYYSLVSGALEVSRNRVHSWHVGINPHTRFDGSIEDDFDGWCALSFASPRYLHFHTCGDVPPCEIAWSIFNPTVTIDDQVYWDNGEFLWLHREDNRQLILQREQQQLLEPSADIGL